MHILVMLCVACLLSCTDLRGVQSRSKHPHHHSDSTSSDKDHAFASAYDNVPQTINSVNSFTSVIFRSNQPDSPRHIAHPHSADDTKFEIKHSGVYLISWTITCANPSRSFNDVTSLQLYNETTSNALNPTPFQSTLVVIFPFTFAGQTIVSLKAKTVLQLQVSSQIGGLQILDRNLCIAQIAD